jgi:hypothetical protein
MSRARSTFMEASAASSNPKIAPMAPVLTACAASWGLALGAFPCGVRRVAQGARAELARHVAKGAEELPESQGGEQQLMHKTFWRNGLFATTQKSSAALRMRCLSTQLEGDPRTTPFGEVW